MFSRGPTSTLRAACLLAGAVSTTTALIEATSTARYPTDRDFDTLLVALASWVLLACSAWAVLVCAAVATEAWSSGRVRPTTWVGCPPAVRRTLLIVIGVGLAGGPPGAAMATDPQRPDLSTPGTTVTLPVPARTLGVVTRGPRPEHVVRDGDTLWGIARKRLPPAADPAAVAALVDRLHHVNRDVIGPDPDRIVPGQRLVVPDRNTDAKENS